jgi:superfamily I DNA/RNA helicase
MRGEECPGFRLSAHPGYLLCRGLSHSAADAEELGAGPPPSRRPGRGLSACHQAAAEGDHEGGGGVRRLVVAPIERSDIRKSGIVARGESLSRRSIRATCYMLSVRRLGGRLVREAQDSIDPALIFPGPIALIAGPGSGKTSRLASRIKHLVENRGVDPATITVITFTREAARNMKERLTPPAKAGMPDITLPIESHPATICAMHSLGWRIVGENANRLAMPHGCGLLPIHMRQILFEDAARLCGVSAAFGRRCADRKSKVGAPANDNERAVFETYRRILNACNVIDYDDQIILACELLRQHDDLRRDWQLKATHLLVDEYQDINPPQLEFIQLLCGGQASGLFVVGDDDQSIYGFRGAEPNYIRNFADYFAGGQIKAIADCFRCQPHIIHAAQGFIEAFNPGRIKKTKAICSSLEGAPVCVHSAPSDGGEAEILAAMIFDAINDGDVLVLVPKLDYADKLKAILRKRRGLSKLSDPGAVVSACLTSWLHRGVMRKARWMETPVRCAS